MVKKITLTLKQEIVITVPLDKIYWEEIHYFDNNILYLMYLFVVVSLAPRVSAGSYIHHYHDNGYILFQQKVKQ